MVATASAGFVFTVLDTVCRANQGGFFAALVAAALGEIDFTTDDGLNVPLAGFVEEICGGKEVAVVGDSHGRHFLAGGFVEEFGGFAGAVEKAEIRVDVKMNKLGITHGD